MESFNDLANEDRRLVILQLLAEAHDYRANEYLIQMAVERCGHAVGRDRLRQDAAWLAEQDLARIERVGGVQVIELTTRGYDVAAGRVRVPGVKRPRPGD